jgi:hypothetical protein
MNPHSETSRGQYESVPVAAARVGVSSMIVHCWIASGQLASYRIGTGLLRVDPEELNNLLALPRDVSPVSARRQDVTLSE